MISNFKVFNTYQELYQAALALGISDNSDTAKFDKGVGTYVGSPTAPITSGPIELNSIESVPGGYSIAWYKGPVLAPADFPGGTVVIFNGVNNLNELCRILIDFDKLNNAWTISIQTGATGQLPSADNTPPIQINDLALSDLNGPVIPDNTAPISIVNLSLTDLN